MGVPQLQESLCGCSLETGSKIVGWFFLIVRAIAVISFILEGIAFYAMMHEQPPGSTEESLELLFILCIVAAVFLALFSIFDVLLLVGIYKKRPSFIIPWIVVQAITIWSQMMSLFQPNPEAGDIGATLLGICVSVYLFLIVNSHYRNLKSGNNG